MLRSRKFKRILGVLVGIALIIIVWLVVVTPIGKTNKDKDDKITDVVEDPLGGAVIGDGDKGDITPSPIPEPDDDDIVVNQTDNTPNELAQTGPESISVVAIVGLAVSAYLFMLNKRVKSEAETLTYRDR